MAEGFFFNAPQFANFYENVSDLDNVFSENALLNANRNLKLRVYENIAGGEKQESSHTESDQFFSPVIVPTSFHASASFKENIRRSLSTNDLLKEDATRDYKNVGQSNGAADRMRFGTRRERINGMDQPLHALSRSKVNPDANRAQKFRNLKLEQNQNFQIKVNVNKSNVIKGPLKAQPILSTALKSELTVILPKPSTFEERDKQLVKKKEDHIKKVEEEKKVREFHAKPAVKKILHSRSRSVDNVRKTTISSSENINIASLKATSATVLTKKSFKPKKKDHVQEFHFRTEDRIQARREFVQKRKEREVLMAAVNGEEIKMKERSRKLNEDGIGKRNRKPKQEELEEGSVNS